MTDRQILRDTIRKEIGKITKDWGVWIETVEITNVEICSDTLFKHADQVEGDYPKGSRHHPQHDQKQD